jgi:uncharacterized protein (DUF1499 family)
LEKTSAMARKKNQDVFGGSFMTRLFAYFSSIFSAVFLVGTIGGCTMIRSFRAGPGPSDSSQKEGFLVDCPEKPNCVSTQATKPEHAIVPFTYSKPLGEAKQALKEEIAKISDATLVKEEGPYLHFEFRSRVLRFVDDVEFIFNEETKTLQFRSASRFGYSDWGVNRKRMEYIRNKILGRI